MDKMLSKPCVGILEIFFLTSWHSRCMMKLISYFLLVSNFFFSMPTLNALDRSLHPELAQRLEMKAI